MKFSSLSKKKKISIIINSKGSAFFKCYSVLQKKNNFEFQIIATDMNIQNRLKNKKINCCILTGSNAKFNRNAYLLLKKFNPEKIILFYTKKISKRIHNSFLTFNIHNSLLPLYKGLGAITKTIDNNNKLICSTLHIVDEKFDSGKIITQCSSPLEKENTRYVNSEAFNHRMILFFEALNFKKKKKQEYSIIDKYLVNPTYLSPTYKNILKKLI